MRPHSRLSVIVLAVWFSAAAVAPLLLCRSRQAQYPALLWGTVAAFLAGVYALLQGAWPAGAALPAYTFVSAVRLRRWPGARPARQRLTDPRRAEPSRSERMFQRP